MNNTSLEYFINNTRAENHIFTRGVTRLQIVLDIITLWRSGLNYESHSLIGRYVKMRLGDAALKQVGTTVSTTSWTVCVGDVCLDEQTGNLWVLFPNNVLDDEWSMQGVYAGYAEEVIDQFVAERVVKRLNSHIDYFLPCCALFERLYKGPQILEEDEAEAVKRELAVIDPGLGDDGCFWTSFLLQSFLVD